MRSAGTLLLALWLLPPARAGAQDDWFGPDKVLHFVANVAITTISYSVAINAWDMERRDAMAFGVGVSSAVSLAKEFYDLHTDGHFSGRDLVWDALGMGTGVVLIEALRGRAATDPGGGMRAAFSLLTGSQGSPRGPCAISLRPFAAGDGGVWSGGGRSRLNPIDTPPGPFSLRFLPAKPPGD